MPSSIAEKMIDCMTSVAALAIECSPSLFWTCARSLPKSPPHMSVYSPSAQLAVLYEHPQWFQPLFAALERRSIPYVAIQLSAHGFDPTSEELPAPLVLSRVAQSSFLREPEHPIFYAQSLLDHWARLGARVLNGADVLAI